MKQVLQALDYIHQKKAVHRDVKLENILISRLDSHGGIEEVKLTDFGKSAHCCGDLSLRDPVGSDQYMAPEVINKNTTYGFKADAWSASVVAFSLLSGKLPFHTCDTCTSIQQAINKKELDFNEPLW